MLEKLRGKNIIVYDLEIKKRIEECSKGWNSHDEMGISVGCAFDYRDGKYRVFMDDNIGELTARMNEPGTVIVAFNHISFDNKLMRASGQNLKPDSELINFDMLCVSRVGAGIGADGKHGGRFIGGFKLDHHLMARKLPLKTANGAMAPIWWQEGKVGQVVDYCLNDVTQERALFEDMIVHGETACSYKKEAYKIILPKELTDA